MSTARYVRRRTTKLRVGRLLNLAVCVVIRNNYTPRFYVAARDPASDLDLTTLQSVYDQHPDVVATEMVARRPGFRRDEEAVLAVDVAHIDRVTPLARQARQLSAYPVGDLACFNVDFSREFRYCLETGADPTPASELSTLRLSVPVTETSNDVYGQLSVAGDGVGVRATTLSGTLRSNHVSASDAGLHLAVRNDIGRLDVVANTVTGSDAGLRLRQSGSRVRANVGTTIEHNTFANNRDHGIDAKTDQGRLTGFSLSDNVLRDNGGRGASLSHYAIGNGIIANNRVVGNGGDGISIRTRSVTGTDFAANTLRNNGRDGLDLRAYTSVRDVAIRNGTVADNGGHGLAITTDLVVHQVVVDDSVLSNNAGAGLLVSSPLTHGGAFDVTDTVVAANAYGIHLRGALRANVSGNEIVYNTNERVDPVPIAGVEPGTGISVAEGPHGAVIERGESAVPLSELVANPRIQAQLANTAPDPETAVVLRTDGDGHARIQAESALPIERALRDLPTGIALPTDGTEPGITMTGNDVTGHPVGLAVDLEPLIDANTTARLLVDGMRTVTAEDTYWDSSSGPFHDSILPAGEGDSVDMGDSLVVIE